MKEKNKENRFYYDEDGNIVGWKDEPKQPTSRKVTNEQKEKAKSFLEELKEEANKTK